MSSNITVFIIIPFEFVFMCYDLLVLGCIHNSVTAVYLGDRLNEAVGLPLFTIHLTNLSVFIAADPSPLTRF